MATAMAAAMDVHKQAIERGEGCAACERTLYAQPSMQLRFSTCCGTAYCTECITLKARAGKLFKCINPNCGQQLSIRQFKAETLDQQRYNREAIMRAKVNKVLNKHRTDFPPGDAGLSAYNDYLEQAQEFVYDLTYGDELDISRADKRLKEYEALHREEISRVYQRIVHDETTAAQLKANANNALAASNGNTNASVAGSVAVGKPVPAPAPFVGPQPKEPKRKPSDTKDAAGDVKPEPDTSSALSDEQQVQAAYTRDLTKQKQRMAGGFLFSYDANRSMYEALDSLLM